MARLVLVTMAAVLVGTGAEVSKRRLLRLRRPAERRLFLRFGRASRDQQPPRSTRSEA